MQTLTVAPPKPCEICAVEIDRREETVHFQKYHAADTTRLGEITWITPHHAVYGGRHYKPKS